MGVCSLPSLCGSGDLDQVFRLGGMFLCPLSHLTSVSLFRCEPRVTYKEEVMPQSHKHFSSRHTLYIGARKMGPWIKGIYYRSLAARLDRPPATQVDVDGKRANPMKMSSNFHASAVACMPTYMCHTYTHTHTIIGIKYINCKA